MITKNDKTSSYQKKKIRQKVSQHFADFIENPKKWYEIFPDDPSEFAEVTELQLVELKDEAKRYHDAETTSFAAKKSTLSKSSDQQWMKTVIAKGTSSDKIAAYTLMIQDKPIYNLNTLHNLISMVKVGKKTECIAAMETLSELFLNDLLKPDSKLLPFYQRPLSLLDEFSSGNISSRKQRLIYWYFEDQLKEAYTTFIQAVTSVAHDSVEANKEKAIKTLYTLLCGNPEQEKNILISLVNKLGDPSQKVASKTIYCLCQLLYRHPNMKTVVLKEIEKLLFRTNVTTKTQYYGICFLSQFYLSNDDQEVAKKLISVYLGFFRSCVKKNEVNSKMMSALLMGVNRAYPYARLELNDVADHIDTMYKIVHEANFNIGLHALNLLFQICTIGDATNDRFYSALYRKLLDPQVTNTIHQAILLSLLFKALKKDKNKDRVNVFIKRLLQIALRCSIPMTCGILYLIAQICRFGNHTLVLQRNSCNVEHKDEEQHEANNSETNEPSNEIQVNVEDKSKSDEKERKPFEKKDYDPFQRNPAYAGGQFCVHDELERLEKHVHPTIALWSHHLSTGQKIIYSGDPLKDYTLIRFLDRFVFKNPKKIDPEDKKLPGYHFKFGERKAYKPSGMRALPVTSKSYLNEVPDKVPVDELFMYTFLKKKMEHSSKTYGKDSDDEDDDVDSVGSDEFEEMLNKMAGKKSNEDEEDVDFMNEIGESLKSSKKKRKRSSDDESSSDEEEEEENEEMDDEMHDMEEFGNEEDETVENEEDDLDFNDDASDFDDEADGDESDEDFSDDEEPETKHSKKKSKKKDNLKSIFAPAEEFAMMLEETGASKIKQGSLHAMSNKDKSDEKQLAWEEKRNNWISRANRAMGKKGFNKPTKKNNSYRNNKMNKTKKIKR